MGMAVEPSWLLFAALFGAVIGSFLNVCIYRIPQGASVVSPPSKCPFCGASVRFYDNIPLVSYLVLRGRCRSCGSSISPLYPLVEALTAFFAAALMVRFGPGADFLVYFAFVSSLIVVTFIDLRLKIIPDVISLPGIVAGVAASFFTASGPGPLDSVAGALLGGGVLLAVACGYYWATGYEGMGGGDVKLLAMIGAFTGWRGAVVALFAGSLAGALLGVVLMALLGKDGKFAVPFGPFLSLGAVFYIFFGDLVVDLYVGAVWPG